MVRVMMVMKLCKRCSHQCATIIAKAVVNLQARFVVWVIFARSVEWIQYRGSPVSGMMNSSLAT